MRYRVISEYVDLKTGERVQPGSLVSFEEPERAERLVQAGCIVPVRERRSAPPKEPAAHEPAGDEKLMTEEARTAQGAAKSTADESQGVSVDAVGADGTGTAG